jgi:hypothetical protein
MLGLSTGQARSIFVQVQLNNTTARQTVFGMGDVSSSNSYLLVEANTVQTAGQRWGMLTPDNAAAGRYDTDAATATSTATLTIVFSTLTSGTDVIASTSYYVDGTLRTLARNGGATAFGSQSGFDTCSISSTTGSTSNSLDGTISSILIYDRALNDTERQQVEAYLGG